MADVFFYGTLRHVPLLEIVLGRPASAIDLCVAHLSDHAVYGVQDQPFPMLQSEPDATADGLLVRGLTDEDVARLQFYEGGFVYDLCPVSVALGDGATARARVFFPTAGAWEAGPLWSLQGWEAQWGAMSVEAAVEVMDYFGRLSADDIVNGFGSLRIRAWARVQSKAWPKDTDRDLTRDVKVISHHRPYVNFFAVEEMTLQFRRHDGSLNAPVNRAALVVGHAAVVLPYDPIRDTVLLIEQFRAPVYMAGDPSPWVWEPVAGLVDPGETPEQAAHREAMEEAGLTLKALEPAGQMYSSTGSSTEFLNLFVGIADLTTTITDGGLATEGEDIQSRIISYQELMDGVDANQFRDMPLITTALWLARHRDRLRQGI